jgi:uncharacterized membrane protein (DUF2068 family)
MANTGLRTIALVEGAKSLAVLAAGTGVLALFHHSLQDAAETLVRHLHLNPASKYPRIFIDAAANLNDTGLLLLAGVAFVYAATHLAEAAGLWLERRWAEWLGVCNGSIYIPFELYEVMRHATALKIGTLLVNAAIVAYLARELWRKRSARK